MKVKLGVILDAIEMADEFTNIISWKNLSRL